MARAQGVDVLKKSGGIILGTPVTLLKGCLFFEDPTCYCLPRYLPLNLPIEKASKIGIEFRAAKDFGIRVWFSLQYTRCPLDISPGLPPRARV